MIYDIIIGGVFGFATTFASGPIKDFTKDHFALDERETHILTFGAMMVAAALLGPLVAGRMNAFSLIIGGMLGVFGDRLYGAAMAMTSKTAKDATVKADDVKDAVVESVEEAVTKDD